MRIVAHLGQIRPPRSGLIEVDLLPLFERVALAGVNWDQRAERMKRPGAGGGDDAPRAADDPLGKSARDVLIRTIGLTIESFEIDTSTRTSYAETKI